jgi:hypothetical protein
MFDTIADAMHRGGPFMLPLVALGPVFIVKQLWSLRKNGSDRIAGQAMLGAAVLCSIGVFATAQGAYMMSDALRHASTETIGVLLMAGSSVSLYTSLFAVALAVVVGFLGLLGGPKATVLPTVSFARNTVMVLLGASVFWVGVAFHNLLEGMTHSVLVDVDIWLQLSMAAAGVATMLASAVLVMMNTPLRSRLSHRLSPAA